MTFHRLQQVIGVGKQNGMASRIELTSDQKTSIVNLADASHKPAEIARLLGIPATTIYSFLKRYRRRGSIENAERSGRPAKITERDTRVLLRTVKRDRSRPLRQLTNLFNEQRNPADGLEEVSKRTVQRKLHSLGYHRRVVKKKIRIREVNRVKRLAWCKANRNKTVGDYWKQVIFSDECKVEIGNNHKVYVWRKAGEEWDRDCLRTPVVKRLSLMIWGCITYNGIGLISVLNGNMNAQNYLDVLENNLWPIFARHFPNQPYIFQDDNAPIHRAHIVNNYMEENNVTTMEWPAQSADLNIIENVWKKLKVELENQAVNITTRVILEDAIRTVWSEISQEYIQNLYFSIPKRIRAVIKAKGSITKY